MSRTATVTVVSAGIPAREQAPAEAIGDAARVLAEQAAALHEITARLRARLGSTRWRAEAARACRAEAEELLESLGRCAVRYDEAAHLLAAAAVAAQALR